MLNCTLTWNFITFYPVDCSLEGSWQFPLIMAVMNILSFSNAVKKIWMNERSCKILAFGEIIYTFVNLYKKWCMSVFWITKKIYWFYYFAFLKWIFEGIFKHLKSYNNKIRTETIKILIFYNSNIKTIQIKMFFFSLFNSNLKKKNF